MNPKTATAGQEAMTFPSRSDASMLPVHERGVVGEGSP